MPSYIALFAGLAFIAWLYASDIRQRKAGSPALWVPGLWLFVLGTRSISYWPQYMGLNTGSTVDTESDPINTVYLGVLLLSAVLVLIKRKFDWELLFRNNRALLLLYLFYALSSSWSPDPFITFRRVVKDFGCVLTGLVILVEARPLHACRVLYFRLACFTLPMSLLVAKYFPAIGRYRARAGDTQYCGLTTHKNTLGEVVLISMLFLVWDLTELPNELPPSELKLARRIRYILLAIGTYLMYLAESATSKVCLALGIFLIFYLAKLARNPNGRRIFRKTLIVGLVLGAANMILGITGQVAELLGRNMTLTGRTEIWDVTLRHQEHPVIGNGFYAFWDTDVAATIYDELGDFIHIRTVHNGYLEVYIDGGFIAVALLAYYLISTGRYSFKRLFDSTPPIVFPFAIWAVAMAYNNSESSYFRLDFLWFTVLAVTMNYEASVGLPKATEHPLSP